MFYKNFKLVVLLVLFSSLLLLIGCTGNTANSQTEDSNTETENDETSHEAQSGGTLIIGMTAGDLPVMDTGPTQGMEGFRFVGFQLYDGLTKFDLTQGDTLPDIVPGLAESWEVPEGDDMTWTFHLREGVTFHDGTSFDADAVIFNLDRILDQDFEYYSPEAAATNRTRISMIESYEKIDDYTVTITTNEPWSVLHESLAFVFMASPTAVKEYGEDYLEHPAGTGPFVYESKVDGQELILVPNENYWGEVPKLDRLILRPMPEPSTRVAALLSGEVNWVEAPSPEAVERIESEGYDIITGEQPHIWRSYLNQEIEELQDPRVRQALNYAIDRESLSNDLIMGLGRPSTQFVYPGHDWYSDDAIEYTYDPDKARELLAEAGYSDGFSGRILVPASGSGHMWPLPMMEFVQQNLAEVGIDLQIDVIEWQTMLNHLRAGFPDDRDALGFAWGTPTHDILSFRNHFHSEASSNHGRYSNPEVDALFDQAFATYDADERNELLREVNRITTDEAGLFYIVHDLNSRAMSPNINGFVQPQSWFVDLTMTTVAE
ncbi:ABC transporter substrate-binding protein [Aquibacillus albus]|uniref:Peptide/nickel transport system substrate-binding protein n=1 Tax=Aquibacillus albus TaxID=1168171 RepID=A0ABS2N6F4_9BACI|nr:ABC transporter substrate-binding protein [Aquibacillus albus]MBM7573704.1 peptide/nickel transport system substrate-binding protein [Aquibacillus albus]